MKNLVQNYYKLQFPDDELGDEIIDCLTFDELWDELGKGNESVYDTIGVGDSIVREGIFAGLAEYKNVTYQVVYNRWLDNSVYKKDRDNAHS